MGLATGKDILSSAPQPQANGKQGEKNEHRQPEIENGSASQNFTPQSQDYFQILARATNDAIRDLDLKTSRIFWPQGLRELLGYELRSTSTTELAFWNERVHPEDRARIGASIREAIAQTDERWTGEYRFQHADGSYLHLLERALILRDANGKAQRLIGSLMDVTARKELQDQLCRSQKMEAFGQLAGGAAHDFNNFLTTILGYSDLVITDSGIKGSAANHVGEIRKAAGRASNLTAQLLAFSRKQALEPRVIEINSVIHNLERSLLRLLGDDISVACHLHSEKTGAHIKADPDQLTQIILNLAVNARDAMPDGGQLTLQTDIVTVAQDRQFEDRHRLSSRDPLAAGEYIVISVIDTGIGMSDEVKEHLFEPFFTTKGEGTGSGLGLATSYGIVHQSGGRIAIESELGHGTRVDIYLPKVSAPISSYKKPNAKNLPTGTETILVLEDDIGVRHLSVRILRGLGYQVIEAANGDDAQRLVAERAGHHVDLLLTDMVMPRMSGRHFADWLNKTSPKTKVVFVSGYLKESLQAGDKIEDGMFFLPKPFDPEQLAQTIRRALDA